MKRKTILITGATGFLGSYITRELFEAGFYLKLLIRNSADRQAKERIFEVFPSFGTTGFSFDTLSERIEIITGDITERHLGLNDSDYSRLSNTVDEIFHCAAAIKFNDRPDNALEYTNVYGTEHVLRFCLLNKTKRLHYIST
ncbi:MAG: SDR family oxidoreductase, partial [Candidatus Brocadia sp.]